ncbi:MAG: hypothetical protein OMM_00118 [Candidatus Magnetoglobus multicellularis str. Araruama]|uniref:Uncharacterized protein n=1 Tax=Candidatus Magnetoglobus multicellularis str. Araruama TaxID=890399 RepID=A0A1V1PIH2_9BACT|nr:MAG: hypothetical protein OMM_00118 [Candidatus Magnetoglobus multicellularis str. Araruama]
MLRLYAYLLFYTINKNENVFFLAFLSTKGKIMITVKCSCGKIYQVKDSYASKKAKCSCGKIISVPDKPDPPLESESNIPPEKICFSCNCGKSFQVSPKFEGKKVRCKSCQTILTVPMQSKSDTDDDQIVDEPVQNEIKSEKQVDEKPKSSEKPKRLLLICLAMVLIGAIAYDLFLMYSEKPEESDKDKPAVTAPAQTDAQDEEQISTEKTTAETIDDSQAPSDEVSSDVEEKTEPEAEAPEAEAPETIKDEAPPEPEASQKKLKKQVI